MRSRSEDDSEESAGASSSEVDTLGKHKELYTTLLKDFNQISKAVERQYGSLAVVNVAPSVVPNPYLPSFRIFSYNISGTAYNPGDVGDSRHGERAAAGAADGYAPLRLGDFVDRESECNEAASGNYTWACLLSEPWHTSPDSPSRTNTLWSPLGYAQVRV